MSKNENDPILAALNEARDAVREVLKQIKPTAKTMPADFDPVTFACEMSSHASAIIAAERKFYSDQTHIGGEAGFLAGYWLTSALLSEQGFSEVKLHRVWLQHADDWLTQEIADNTCT